MLTFDDGPWPGGTDRILELLAAHHVKATFFVWGERASECHDLLRATLNEGHSVQPHCWAHVSHHYVSPEQIQADIDHVLALLREFGADRPQLWRPPWGHWRPGVTDELARGRGMELTGWTIDTNDYAGASASVMLGDVNARLDVADDASAPVVLMHDCPLEPGQRKMREHVDETVDLVRRLLVEARWSFGPQADPVADHLDPPRT